MVLMAVEGKTAPEIAPLVLRSDDTVTRVLKRYLEGDLDAVPRKKPPGGSADGDTGVGSGAYESH